MLRLERKGREAGGDVIEENSGDGDDSLNCVVRSVLHGRTTPA